MPLNQIQLGLDEVNCLLDGAVAFQFGDHLNLTGLLGNTILPPKEYKRAGRSETCPPPPSSIRRVPTTDPVSPRPGRSKRRYESGINSRVSIGSGGNLLAILLCITDTNDDPANRTTQI